MSNVLGPYFVLFTRKNGVKHYFTNSREWQPNGDNPRTYLFKNFAKRTAKHFKDRNIEIETRFLWLPPIDSTEYSCMFWDINTNEPLDFEKFTNDGLDKIIITQGKVKIVLPESELFRLFGWYFELEDHNAVLELVERIDK